jgi:site-specific DNA recombinase
MRDEAPDVLSYKGNFYCRSEVKDPGACLKMVKLLVTKNFMFEELKQLKPGSYCRKSQEDEDKQVLSIPAQMEEAEKIKKRYSFDEVPNYSESKSARFPGKRKELAQMLKDLKSGKIDAVICWKLDRLARNMAEGGEIIDLLQRGVIKAIITPYKVYLPNENALFMALEFGSANQFSRDLSVNVKRGQTQKAQRGFPHGLAALGFTNDRSYEKGNRKWLVDQARFPMVKKLIEMFLTGRWSAGKLARYAREELKLTTPRHKKIGGALVSKSRIHEMLRDPIYAGIFYYGGVKYELHKDLPRIITEEQYNKILQILSAKNIPKTKTHHVTFTGFVQSPEGDFIGPDLKFQLICDCKHKFAYSNKSSCPKCNRLIEDLENPKYLEYRFYYNVARRKNHLKTKSVKESELNDYIVGYFSDNLELSPALAEWSKKYLYELRDKDVEVQRAASMQSKDQLEIAEKKKKKIIQMMTNESLSEDDGKAALQDVNAQIAASNKTTAKTDWFDCATDIADLTREFVETMQSDVVEAKRSILSRLGSNLVWNEEKVSVINKKWVDVLAAGLREAKFKNPKFEPKYSEANKDKTDAFASVCPILLRG